VRALPGDPARSLLGQRATPASVENVNRLYGFDKPLHEQYVTYISALVQGDFGSSTQTGQPVVELFKRGFPATAELALLALAFAVIVGIPLGYYAARRHGTALDSLTVGASLLGVTIPVFFLAYLLKLVFAIGIGPLAFLGVFPTSGRQNARIDATHITDFYVLDGILTQEWDAAWDALFHLVLPALALGTIPLAIIVRITRAAVLDVTGEDYVRTAEAKGLLQSTDPAPPRAAQRAAAGGDDGRAAGRPAAVRGGAHRDGVRDQRAGGDAVRRHHAARLPVLQGFILAIALMYALINLLVDVLYGVIDPRVRVS
jgi:peptide/nickel transport system permease protein